MTEESPPAIHAAMLAASKAIGPIGKNLRNVDSGYAARSIDDILDAVHGPLDDAGVVLYPRTLQRLAEARTSRGGGAVYHVAVEVEYRFVAAEDGSEASVIVWGEAMDSSDKAGNKALSAALKMGLIQAFTIPVTGEAGDADSSTPEAVAREVLEDSPAYVERLTDRLRALSEATGGDPYPPTWRASSLAGLPWYRKNGITPGEYVAALAVLEPLEALIEESAAQTPGAQEGAQEAPIPWTCAECGTTNPEEHKGGCSQEPF